MNKENVSGKALRAFRLDAGLTQRQLAEMLGTSSDYLSLIERGKRPVPAYVAKAFETVCNVVPTRVAVKDGVSRMPHKLISAKCLSEANLHLFAKAVVDLAVKYDVDIKLMN